MNSRKNAGFSLVELTTAMFVLGVGMMGTLQMYNVASHKLRTMRESDVASRAVDAELEALRARAFAQLAETENAPFVTKSLNLDELAEADGAVSIRPHPDTRLKLVEVTATLRWKTENRRVMQKSATTYITEKGAE